MNFLMIHEMVHNSEVGRAVVQQSWDRHLESGGSTNNYDASSHYFTMQEQMTNTLAKQIAGQIGVTIDPDGEGGFPPPGYYQGSELIPPE